jgi:cGMP-dependent protein kinase
MNDKEKNEIKQDLEQIEFLSKLTDSQKTMLANNTFLLKYQPKQAIVNKGDKADSFYLVKSGKVGCYNGDQFIRYLEKGDSFGEQALYKDGVRSLSVIAEEETQCLAISRESLIKIFGQNLEIILLQNTVQWILRNDPIMSQLDKLQIFKISNRLELFESEEKTALETQDTNL